MSLFLQDGSRSYFHLSKSTIFPRFSLASYRPSRLSSPVLLTAAVKHLYDPSAGTKPGQEDAPVEKPHKPLLFLATFDFELLAGTGITVKNGKYKTSSIGKLIDDALDCLSSSPPSRCCILP